MKKPDQGHRSFCSKDYEGPVQPGSLFYRLLQMIAREVAKALERGAGFVDKPGTK
jgi:hypothetical protein